MEVGKMLAEGGQAELYIAYVNWCDLNHPNVLIPDYVFKVLRGKLSCDTCIFSSIRIVAGLSGERVAHWVQGISRAEAHLWCSAGAVIAGRPFLILLERETTDLRSYLNLFTAWEPALTADHLNKKMKVNSSYSVFLFGWPDCTLFTRISKHPMYFQLLIQMVAIYM